MEESTKVQINLLEPEDEATVTILQGNAPKPIEPSPYNFSGRIDAAGNFYSKRKDTLQFEPENCVLLVNYERKMVELNIFPDLPAKSVHIVGRLETDHVLDRFKINSDQRYTRDEMARLFKFHRNAFAHVDEGTGFVKKLKDFTMKFNQAFESNDNQRGNKKLLMERVIEECSLPETITLHLPVFKGQEARTAVVDVLFDVGPGGDVVFSLESADLAEAIEKETRIIIDEEVKRFNNEIAVIYG